MALTQEKLESLNQLCWGIYKRTFGAPFWESVADILAPQQVTPEADRYHDRLVEALTLICGPDATYNTQLKGIEIGKSLLPEIEKEASQ